jgi:serine/threonine protein phosphatase PrpC
MQLPDHPDHVTVLKEGMKSPVRLQNHDTPIVDVCAETPCNKCEIVLGVAQDVDPVEPAAAGHTHSSMDESPVEVVESAFIIQVDSSQGSRPSMQDAFFRDIQPDKVFVAIFDGHGTNWHGPHPAAWCRDNIKEIRSKNTGSYSPKASEWVRMYEIMQDGLQKIGHPDDNDADDTGCAALTMTIQHDPSVGVSLSLANVGDVKAVAFFRDKHQPLSYDHRCTDNGEMERVEQRGGKVIGGRAWGYLALSRRLGIFTPEGVTCIPDIVTRTFEETDCPTIVIGTDGLWDHVSISEIDEMLASERPSAKLVSQALANAKESAWHVLV